MKKADLLELLDVIDEDEEVTFIFSDWAGAGIIELDFVSIHETRKGLEICFE